MEEENEEGRIREKKEEDKDSRWVKKTHKRKLL